MSTRSAGQCNALLPGDERQTAKFVNCDPVTLSGGQRARVAVLRTLLAEWRALLLDEPFRKLDAALRAEFRAFIYYLRAQPASGSSTN